LTTMCRIFWCFAGRQTCSIDGQGISTQQLSSRHMHCLLACTGGCGCRPTSLPASTGRSGSLRGIGRGVVVQHDAPGASLCVEPQGCAHVLLRLLRMVLLSRHSNLPHSRSLCLLHPRLWPCALACSVASCGSVMGQCWSGHVHVLQRSYPAGLGVLRTRPVLQEWACSCCTTCPDQRGVCKVVFATTPARCWLLGLLSTLPFDIEHPTAPSQTLGIARRMWA
jgi:hypothetical protein